MRSRVLFAVAAVAAAVVLVVVWTSVLLNGNRPVSVPEGQTASVHGITWHLDSMTQVTSDDPALANSYLDDIPGAVYVLAQFTYEAPDQVTVCGGFIIGANRQWMMSGVTPVSDDISPACQPATTATMQVVATIPPTAVPEIHAVQVSVSGVAVNLEGHVT